MNNRYCIAAIRAVVFLACLCSVAKAGGAFYSLDLGKVKKPSPDSRVTQKADHSMGVAKLRVQSLEDGQEALKVTFADRFTGTVTLDDISFEEIRGRRSFYWLSMVCQYKASVTNGTVQLMVDCIDEDGKTMWSQALSTFSESAGFTSVKKPLFGLPKARPDREICIKARLYLCADSADAELVIKSIDMDHFKISKNQRDLWRNNDRVVKFGGMEWFDPCYTEWDSASPLLRDTGHKLLAAVGCTDMRADMTWGEMRYDWICCDKKDGKYVFRETSLDKRIDELDYYGLKLTLITITSTPTWTHNKKVPDDMPARIRTNKRAIAYASFPPDDWRHYEEFVEQMVTYFKAKGVYLWEPWNEPDAYDYGLSHGYESFKEYLPRFFKAAKRADPDCTVLSGRVGSWLPWLFRDGMDQYFDAISTHPYPRVNNEDGNLARSIPSKITQMQCAMLAHGIVKPIYCTEVGLGAGWPWNGPSGCPGEAKKAQNLKHLLGTLKEYCENIVWYTTIEVDKRYGLIRFEENDRYRPVDAYYAYGQATGKFNDTENQLQVSVDLPKEALKQGHGDTARLSVKNVSSSPKSIRFWPVGFIEKLGCDFQQIRNADWQGTLLPGEVHQVELAVSPTDDAFGTYPVGLAVTSKDKNCLKLGNLKIWELSQDARFESSSHKNPASLALLNDLTWPEWSGDEEVSFLDWSPKKGNKEWIEIKLPQSQDVAGLEVYWADDTPPVRSTYGNRDYRTYRIPEKVTLLYWKDGKWQEHERFPQSSFKRDRFSKLKINPIEKITKMRLEIQAQKGYSLGIYEIKIMPLQP